MLRYAVIATLLAVVLPSAPSFAVTREGQNGDLQVRR